MKRHTVPAGEFKNACLRLMDEVSRHGIPITVTKRGRPLVRIVPAHEPTKARSLLGTIVRQDDDITSTDESWDAER